MERKKIVLQCVKYLKENNSTTTDITSILLKIHRQLTKLLSFKPDGREQYEFLFIYESGDIDETMLESMMLPPFDFE